MELAMNDECSSPSSETVYGKNFNTYKLGNMSGSVQCQSRVLVDASIFAVGRVRERLLYRCIDVPQCRELERELTSGELITTAETRDTYSSCFSNIRLAQPSQLPSST